MEDLIIAGGRIIDPASNTDRPGDVLIKNGRIASVCQPGELQRGGAERVIDARGCVVTPGLIDCHVHAYQHATPLGIGIDECCLARGVTTVIDAGSAGCATLDGLRKFIGDQNKCRLLALVHIASHGLASAGCSGLKTGGELDSLNQVDVEECVSSVRNNRDFVVGIKLRLSTSIADNGRTEHEAFRRSLQAASEADVPLMVHHAISSVPTVQTPGVLSCPGSLRAGDIYTHAFHFHKGNIVDSQTGKVHPDVWEAKRRGVLFDVGHGAGSFGWSLVGMDMMCVCVNRIVWMVVGSFGWSLVETCVQEGFWPDLISTDLHVESLEGPAYDLATVMTKMMHVGMPLPDVIAATTSGPAAAIGKSGELGALKVGNEADVTVLRVEPCDVELEDARGEVRAVRQRVVPVRVFRAGREHPIRELQAWPCPASKEKCQHNTQRISAYLLSQQSEGCHASADSLPQLSNN
ncbi:hypothetical protein ACOMHN_033856 [Nucella lapillus]